MQLLYKSPSSTTEDFEMSRSDYFKLFETLRTRKDLALYVRKLNMDENVIGLEEVLENCSALLELELCYELVQAMRLYTEEGTMINNLKKLKSLKINGRWCNFTTVFRFIRAIAGRDLSELQAPGIRGNDDIPSTPSLPFRISTLTSLDAQFSTLVPFLPIQPHLLLRLSLFLFGSVYSFEILRPFSKLQYLSITGGEAEYDAWDWSGNSDECYDILGYFPELLEIELKHPKPISIKAFSLLLDTSPNLRKIYLTSTTWRLDPQTMISDQLSKILKGKKLESVDLGILSCSAEEEVAMLRIQQELEMLDGCNLSWKGPYIEEFDNSDRYDEQSDFNSGYFGHNYGVDEDGWDSDADRRALD